ncbi:MAG: 50S ribosomal protein L21 [Abditibacteriota bacterium]|nr:50S ribosomal protein L21 [Abditibacteriota bacterium]
MYAIVKAGGKQYKVSENDVINVNKLDVAEGDEIVLDEVLLVSDGYDIKVGAPYVDGAKVTAKAVKQFRDKKINAWTYRPKKHTQRHYGHRQYLTSVSIEKITF